MTLPFQHFATPRILRVALRHPSWELILLACSSSRGVSAASEQRRRYRCYAKLAVEFHCAELSRYDPRSTQTSCWVVTRLAEVYSQGHQSRRVQRRRRCVEHLHPLGNNVDILEGSQGSGPVRGTVGESAPNSIADLACRVPEMPPVAPPCALSSCALMLAIRPADVGRFPSRACTASLERFTVGFSSNNY